MSRNNERAGAQLLADVLADCYGVRATSGLWERYRRYVQRRWQLTDTEARVAVECLRGYQNPVIAQMVGASIETVNKHLDAVYRKAGVHGRSELAAVVLQEVGNPE